MGAGAVGQAGAAGGGAERQVCRQRARRRAVRQVRWGHVAGSCATCVLKPWCLPAASAHGCARRCLPNAACRTARRVLALALAEWLCANHETDSKASRLVKDLHLFLMPTMNPDGFAAKTRENRRGPKWGGVVRGAGLWHAGTLAPKLLVQGGFRRRRAWQPT